MAGERYLYAPAEAQAPRLAEAVHTVEAEVEVEVYDDRPGTFEDHPVMIVYAGATDAETMAARLRAATTWDVRTERELESAVSA